MLLVLFIQAMAAVTVARKARAVGQGPECMSGTDTHAVVLYPMCTYEILNMLFQVRIGPVHCRALVSKDGTVNG